MRGIRTCWATGGNETASNGTGSEKRNRHMVSDYFFGIGHYSGPVDRLEKLPQEGRITGGLERRRHRVSIGHYEYRV